MNRYKYYYDAAVSRLHLRGYHIIGRVLVKGTIIAWDSKTDEIVFAKVRRHAKLSYRTRLRYELKAKRLEFQKVCAAWLRANKWHGAWRIDIIDVYGYGDVRPLVDHIISVEGYGRFKKQ